MKCLQKWAETCQAHHCEYTARTSVASSAWSIKGLQLQSPSGDPMCHHLIFNGSLDAIRIFRIPSSTDLTHKLNLVSCWDVGVLLPGPSRSRS